jgi:glycosyltransferase involved in cell wall biosynthesis
MKVCHVTSVHPTFDIRIFHKECKTLAQAGHDVTLIAQADWKEKVVDGVRVIGLPRIGGRHQRLRLWRQIVSKVRRLGPDIVHFHDPELLLIASFFRPARLIYDCHESYAEAMLSTAWIPPSLRHIVSRLVAFLEPTLARRTDAIVVTVDSHAAPFQKAKRPIVILHNFPLLSDFDVARCADGKTVIHLGSQDKVRGCSIIIEAMKLVVERVPEARLLLVGHFHEREYKAEIHQLIAAYHLEKAVVLTGRVPYADIPKWLAQADVGLIALQETEKFKTCIPTKLFEYMASRLPVVASDLPPARRFMNGLDCGFLVEPAHPQAYAEAIEYLLSHPAEAKRMAENGPRAVEETYNWGSEAEKLVKLYQKLG